MKHDEGETVTHDDLSLVTQAGERTLGVSAVALAVGLVANWKEDRKRRRGQHD